MINIKRNAKIFILFSRYSLKTILQARLGVLFFLFGKIFRFVLLLLFIVLIFSHTKVVKGYGLNQVIIFFLTFNIIDTGTQIIFREVYRFRPLVVSGALDLILLKPHHPFLRVLVGGVDFLDVVMLLPFFGLLAYFAAQINALHLLPILGFFVLLISGMGIAAAFHIIALALGILTTEIDHTMMIYRDLTTLGRFPMNIYREPVRTIFTFFIPIGVMMSFPAEVLTGQGKPSFFILSFLISCIMLFLSIRLWNHAIKKYQSWGG